MSAEPEGRYTRRRDEPMTEEEIRAAGRYTRAALKELLPAWGDFILTHATTRGISIREAVGVAINTGTKHGSRSPVPIAYLDASIAFLALTHGQQRIVAQYYIEVAQERPELVKPRHTGDPAIDAGPFGEEEYLRKEEAQERIRGRRPSEQSVRALAERMGEDPDKVESSLRRATDDLLGIMNNLQDGMKRRRR